MSGTNKLAAEKNQRILLDLVNQPGNDTCADCKARAPRWASHNLGIFICVNCASIHRKIGTHITKVKSVTLDTWAKDQVENMKSIGNLKSNARYNPDETRHPPPTNMIDSERDSELEKYIRAKYEFRSFEKRDGPSSSMATSVSSEFRSSKPSALSSSSSLEKSAVVSSLLGPSRSLRSVTLPPSTFSSSPTVPPKSNLSTPNRQSTLATPVSAPLTSSRSVSQPSTLASAPVSQTTFSNSTLSDLRSLQSGTIDATLPLQVASTPITAPPAMSSISQTSYPSAPNPFHNLSAMSAPPYTSSFAGTSPGAGGNGLSISPGMGPGLSNSYARAGANISPFQPSPINPTGAPFAPMNSTPSPNPFAPQNNLGMGTPGGYGIPQPMQPQTSFGGNPMFTGQQYGQQQMQPQGFAPQPQMQYAQPQAQMHVSTPGNPFIPAQTTPSPFMGSTPSPFGGAQPMQQMNTMQQPQQANFGATNPFTSWIQQAPPGQQQGGYTQQWGR